jgi:hypothetical protein
VSQTAIGAANAGRAGRPLGVIEAMGMGWRLVMSDFWRLWVVALVQALLLMGANSVLGIVAVVLILPPLAAGMFYVVARRIDGHPAEVGGLFKGFQDRFGEAVVGFLPVAGASLVFGMLLVFVIVAAVLAGIGLAAAAEHEAALAVLLVVLDAVLALLLISVLVLIVNLFTLFFIFLFPAVWDHPESGWTAAKASVRLVKEHFWSVIGLVLLFWLLGHAAGLVGLLACCIGVLFTGPFVGLWQIATVTYLYHSWTGRPLAQGA